MTDPAFARWWRGIRLALPVGLTYIPVAFSLGLLAVKAGVDPWIAALMSAIVFAGASQFAALAMLRAAVPTVEIVLATLFINLRHIVFNLALVPKLGIRSLAKRALVAVIMTDEGFTFGSLSADPGIRAMLDERLPVKPAVMMEGVIATLAGPDPDRSALIRAHAALAVVKEGASACLSLSGSVTLNDKTEILDAALRALRV